jgi:valyl-tRNA synthetase
MQSQIDVNAEIQKLEQELKYQQGFLTSVMKKLENEKFVNNAPAQVVEMEKKKQADTQAKIRVIEDQLKTLKA